MVFAKNIYTSDHSIEKVFDYFLQKEYIRKFEKNSKSQVISTNENSFISEGEILELIVEEEKDSMIFRIKIKEIIPSQSILMEFKFEDYEDEDEDFSAGFANVMNRHLGGHVFQKIEFQENEKQIRIIETTFTAKDVSIFGKMACVLSGIYHKFFDKERRREIQQAINKF